MSSARPIHVFSGAFILLSLVFGVPSSPLFVDVE
jgi:hypothetical protein